MPKKIAKKFLVSQIIVSELVPLIKKRILVISNQYVNKQSEDCAYP